MGSANCYRNKRTIVSFCFEKDCGIKTDSDASKTIDALQQTSVENMLSIITTNRHSICEITPKNIPQFSNIDDMYPILDYVDANPGGSYDLFGYFFNKDASLGAQRKYGENHYKLAMLSGLVTVPSPTGLTPLGALFRILPLEEKNAIRPKLFLRIPIIQQVMIDALNGKAYPKKYMKQCLSVTTANRRKSNVKRCLFEVCSSLENGNEVFRNIQWIEEE